MFQDRQSQKAVSRSFNFGIIQIMIGGFLSFIFGITFISCFVDLFSQDSTTGVDDFIIITVIFGLSVYLLLRGMRRLKLVKLFRSYIQLLSQAPSHSIDQLANILKSPVHIVRNNLLKMLKKNYIVAAYIDDNTNSLMSTSVYHSAISVSKPNPNTNLNQNPNLNQNNVVQPQKMIEYITATCKNCGASNKLMKGGSIDCEYCGSNIH